MKKYVTILTAIFCLMLIFDLNTKAEDVETEENKIFYYKIINGSLSLSKYEGSDYEVFIPSTSNGKTVTEIGCNEGDGNDGEGAFALNKKITKVTIPGTVKKIRRTAFLFCENLTTVSIPNSVTVIESSAFAECWKLKNIVIPNRLTAIAEETFMNCESLTSISIPDSVKTIRKSAFNNCSSMKSLSFGNNLTSIGEYAFSACYKLTNISFPGKLDTIGAWAFSDCSKLKSVSLPANLKTIDGYAFYACPNMKTYTIPKSVTKIGKCALGYTWEMGEDGCTLKDVKLSGITIQGYTGTAAEKYAIDNGFPFVALDAAGKSATDFSTNQSAGTAPVGSVQTVNNRDYYVSSDHTVVFVRPAEKTVTAVAIPSQVTIGGNNYQVTAIYKKAFANSKQLQAVMIPETVRIIGAKAFYKCKKLKRIYVNTSLLTKAAVGKAAFRKIHKKAKFYVPRARKKYYKKLFRKRGAPSKIKVKGF